MIEQQSSLYPASPRIVVVIVDDDKADRVKKIVNDSFFLWTYVISCVGTARSELLDVLGLGETEKSLLIFFEPNFRAGEIVRRLSERMDFDRPGMGIAFTVSLSGMSNTISKMFSEERLVKIAEALRAGEKAHIMNILKQAREESVSDTQERAGWQMDKENEKHSEVGYRHDLILAVVNQGYSDELMSAARSAGASGGTVVQARRSGREETVKFFGISLQEEKEIIAILAKRESRKSIMKAINQACGITTDAAGIVFSVPVDGVEGLGETVGQA